MSITQVRWLRSGSREHDLPLAHAARQLTQYAERLTGQDWPVKAARTARSAPGTAWLGTSDQLPEPPTGALAPDPWDDGFAIWSADDQLYIAGRNSRSVLFGVYAFLETQGVRFLRPGPNGEILPKLEEITLPAEPILEIPRYRHRGLCIEGAPSINHACRR